MLTERASDDSQSLVPSGIAGNELIARPKAFADHLAETASRYVVTAIDFIEGTTAVNVSSDLLQTAESLVKIGSDPTPILDAAELLVPNFLMGVPRGDLRNAFNNQRETLVAIAELKIKAGLDSTSTIDNLERLDGLASAYGAEAITDKVSALRLGKVTRNKRLKTSAEEKHKPTYGTEVEELATSQRRSIRYHVFQEVLDRPRHENLREFLRLAREDPQTDISEQIKTLIERVKAASKASPIFPEGFFGELLDAAQLLNRYGRSTDMVFADLLGEIGIEEQKLEEEGGKLTGNYDDRLREQLRRKENRLHSDISRIAYVAAIVGNQVAMDNALGKLDFQGRDIARADISAYFADEGRLIDSLRLLSGVYTSINIATGLKAVAKYLIANGQPVGEDLLKYKLSNLNPAAAGSDRPQLLDPILMIGEAKAKSGEDATAYFDLALEVIEAWRNDGAYQNMSPGVATEQYINVAKVLHGLGFDWKKAMLAARSELEGLRANPASMGHLEHKKVWGLDRSDYMPYSTTKSEQRIALAYIDFGEFEDARAFVGSILNPLDQSWVIGKVVEKLIVMDRADLIGDFANLVKGARNKISLISNVLGLIINTSQGKKYLEDKRPAQ